MGVFRLISEVKTLTNCLFCGVGFGWLKEIEGGGDKKGGGDIVSSLMGCQHSIEYRFFFNY